MQTITYDDARAIADPINVPSAALVSPEVFLSGQFIYQAQNTTGTINAVPQDAVPHLADMIKEAGRRISHHLGYRGPYPRPADAE